MGACIGYLISSSHLFLFMFRLGRPQTISKRFKNLAYSTCLHIYVIPRVCFKCLSVCHIYHIVCEIIDNKWEVLVVSGRVCFSSAVSVSMA